MPRRTANRDIEKGFIWIIREAGIVSDVTISGVSVKNDMLSASFERALSPEIGMFKLNLINADGKYSDLYTGGETVILKMDLGNSSKIITVDSAGGQQVILTEGERI